MNADTVAGAIRQSPASLGPRLLTAAVLATGALASVYFGGIAFLAVVTALTAIVCFEWIKMSCPARSSATLLLAIAVVALSGALFAVCNAQSALAAGAAGAIAVGLSAKLQRNNPIWPAAGVFVFVVSMAATLWLRAEEAAGLATLLWLFVVVWATDSGAYLFGNLIGGAALAPRISPGKTWAGAVGGLAGGTLLGVGMAMLLQDLGVLERSGDLAIIAAASAVLSFFSQAGDLAESAAKRLFGVKDSGAWLPGHGGALDRLDSLIFATPILALAVLLAGGSASLLTWVGS